MFGTGLLEDLSDYLGVAGGYKYKFKGLDFLKHFFEVLTIDLVTGSTVIFKYQTVT